MFYKKNSSEDLENTLFENPTSEYRATPFWAWNCKMTPELLEAQIDGLKQMGFGGFHMHSRAGMAVPYLQDDFMNIVKFCTRKAKDKGMYAYLYDEDKWPSGYAGGYVTKNHKYRQRWLVFSLKKPEGFDYEAALNQGKTYIIAVYDISLNDQGELKEYRRISENENAKGKKWYAYIETAKDTPWFNNQAYVDTLDKESINEFIKVTYETYKEAVGEEFGETIPSIFTDEPQFAKKSPLGFADSNDNAIFPWTFSFTESFQKKYGYDILEKLPEIVWNLSGNAISEARYHYHDHIADKFTENYADNCGKWCRKHNIAFAGHLAEEPTLLSQSSMSGEVMRSYRAFDIPGIDMLCNWVEHTTAKQCQSVVHQYGREAMASELYGVTNWDFDFRGHKFQGDWQAALGVTVRVPHLAWVSMAGEAKRDYPASINYQSPWYKEYGYVENHFARLNTALTRGKPMVNVAVIHPIESYWINFGPVENTFSIRTQLDKKFNDIVDWLLFGAVDFDFISESLLPDLAHCVDNEMFVGKMKYEAIVVPDCITLRKTTLEMLKKFNEMGGSVIFAGSCPKYIDAVLSDEAKELYDKSVCVPFDKVAILDALKDCRNIEIKDASGAPTENLIYTMRHDKKCDWLFIAHGAKESSISAENTRPQEIRIFVDGKYTPIIYDTLSGERYAADYQHKNNKTVIRYTLYRHDSILIRLENADEICDFAQKQIIEAKQDHYTIRFKSKVKYARTEPNVLMLDRAEYSLNDEAFNEEEEILILDNKCRERKGWPLRCNGFAQPWVVAEEPIQDSITLRFNINSETLVSGASLAIEDAEELEIAFNGEKVPANVTGWYVDKAIKTVSLPDIKAGKNVLVVKIPFGKRTNTEWCYILGDFNVKLEGAVATLIPPTEEIGFSSLTAQGMPFYGGNIIYKTEIDVPACTAVIHTTYYRGALIKALVDGKEAGKIVFSPYELKLDLTKGKHIIEFELFGTRINTFGGVHNVTQPEWVGPDFWRTRTVNWCYEYVLKDTGLLAAPIIDIYEMNNIQ